MMIGALFRGVSEDSHDATPVVRENSAVYQALKDGRVEEARELLEKLQLEEEEAMVQEVVNGENEGAATVLHAAAAHGDEEVRLVGIVVWRLGLGRLNGFIYI